MQLVQKVSQQAVLPEHGHSACVTCGAAAPGVFCASCGQRQGIGRHTLRSLITGVLRRAIGEDGAISTVWLLAVQPGRVIKDYTEGRTVRYVHPAAYLVLTSAVFALTVQVLDGPSGAGNTDKLLALLIVPFIAAAARALFWRDSYNLAEHLIAVMYLVAEVVLFLAVCYAGTALVPESAERAYATTSLALGAAYFVWAYSCIFERRLFSAVRAAAALGFGIALWISSVVLFVTMLRR